MKTTPAVLLRLTTLALILPTAVLAQNTLREGYLLDGRGNFVGSGTPGQCWHTGSWTPALAVEPCDPVMRKVAAITPAVAPTAAAPTPPAPMAAPIALAPVAKAMPQKLNFAADALFAFDKSALNPEGKKMLDDLSVQLKGATYEHVNVTGHTDRLGSAAYNQKLSNTRAAAVRDYLVGTGIASNRIDAQGMGETQPVTAAGACPGKQSATVITCLAADRRVDVEVQGTQASQL